MDDKTIVFHGEMQLRRWSETSGQGSTITLQLADAGDLDKFKNMALPEGKKVGQRLAVVMVEIGDDEKPVEQPEVEKKEKPGEFCIMACTFCKDPLFLRWSESPDEESAKHYILIRCDVESRKELDFNKDARFLFHKNIREPFIEWRLSNFPPIPQEYSTLAKNRPELNVGDIVKTNFSGTTTSHTITKKETGASSQSGVLLLLRPDVPKSSGGYIDADWFTKV